MDYQFIGDAPQAMLGDTLWQPSEIRTVSAAQAAELDRNVNWRPAPPIPEQAVDPAPDTPLPDVGAETEPTEDVAPQGG